MKTVALSDVKNDPSKYLRAAEQAEVVITRHGKPAGALKGALPEIVWVTDPTCTMLRHST